MTNDNTPPRLTQEVDISIHFVSVARSVLPEFLLNGCHEVKVIKESSLDFWAKRVIDLINPNLDPEKYLDAARTYFREACENPPLERQQVCCGSSKVPDALLNEQANKLKDRLMEEWRKPESAADVSAPRATSEYLNYVSGFLGRGLNRG